jgi:hypothetical protein
VRRAILLLPLLLAALVLASCGKGGRAGSQTTSSAAAPSAKAGGSGSAAGGAQGKAEGDGKAEGGSPSRAGALAFAQAVNLTQADVPGFSPKQKEESSSPREKKLEKDVQACVGVSGVLTKAEKSSVVEQGSENFELKHEIVDLSVSSSVSVQPSAEEARRALQAIRNAHVRSCFSHYLQLLFSGLTVKGATPGPVTIQSGDPPAPGTAGGFGWRITASFIVHGIEVPVYLDFLGFVDGPAEVTLLSSGLIRPFPATIQQHLFRTLLSRAKEHTP